MKVLQLHDTMSVRWGIAVLGPSCAGASLPPSTCFTGLYSSGPNSFQLLLFRREIDRHLDPRAVAETDGSCAVSADEPESHHGLPDVRHSQLDHERLDRWDLLVALAQSVQTVRLRPPAGQSVATAYCSSGWLVPRGVEMLLVCAVATRRSGSFSTGRLTLFGWRT
jgi:hypothetical protein